MILNLHNIPGNHILSHTRQKEVLHLFTALFVEKSHIKIMVNKGRRPSWIYGKLVSSHQLDFRGFLICYVITKCRIVLTKMQYLLTLQVSKYCLCKGDNVGIVNLPAYIPAYRQVCGRPIILYTLSCLLSQHRAASPVGVPTCDYVIGYTLP